MCYKLGRKSIDVDAVWDTGSQIFCSFIVNPCELLREHLNQESAAEFVKNVRQNLGPGDFALKFCIHILIY